MTFHKVTNIKALPGFLLLADFADGSQTCYKLSELWNRIPAFSDLKTVPGLFELVKVDAGEYGVSWNDDLDLSADELYAAGIRLKEPIAIAPGECCPACGQMVRKKSVKQAAASRKNGCKGGRPSKAKKELVTT